MLVWQLYRFLFVQQMRIFRMIRFGCRKKCIKQTNKQEIHLVGFISVVVEDVQIRLYHFLSLASAAYQNLYAASSFSWIIWEDIFGTYMSDQSGTGRAKLWPPGAIWDPRLTLACQSWKNWCKVHFQQTLKHIFSAVISRCVSPSPPLCFIKPYQW